MSTPSPHPLSHWRPRYWLPASVSQLAMKDQTFLRLFTAIADVALALFVAGLAWEFREDLRTINAPDWMLLIGLVGVAHMALAVYLPAILLRSSPLKTWWLAAGPLPLDSQTSRALDRVLRQNPEAGPLMLGWLIQQRLEQVHMAHAIKVLEAPWQNSPATPAIPSALGLEEVQARARAHLREEHLEKTLAPPQEQVAPKRPRL